MLEKEKKDRILVVDDELAILRILQKILTKEGFTVFSATGVSEALKILETSEVELVITDYKMPRFSGLDLIRHVRENCRNTEVLMITGYPSIEGAIRAVKTGADEYLSKPFTAQELMVAVRNALDKLKARMTSKRKEKPSSETYNMVGRSEGMMKVFKSISRASAASATVLITGESGTGKELVARAIHYSSSRGSSSFIPVNCGGIPEALLDSELFGTGKGDYSQEKSGSMSLFQVADGGTLFLDGIGSLPQKMQTKLLRLLEDKEIFISSTGTLRKLNVRIIAATNKDLKTMVQNGTFREDLFYRLNVISILLPPLRERIDDIPPLADHFAEKFGRDLGKGAITFTEYAIQIMRQYFWPGNVRELENLVQQISIMTEQPTVDVTDLPQYMRYNLSNGDRGFKTLAEMEKEYIQSVIAQVGGNKSRAAELLGIDRKTLREKLKKFGEDDE